MLHVTCNQLKDAFNAHGKALQGQTNTSAYLVRFYAVECGLKSIYLRNNNYKSTKDIQKDIFKTRAHQLDYWVKELNIPKAEVRSTPKFSIQEESNKRTRLGYTIGDAHQAWRYGIKIVQNDEKKLKEWLDKIYEYLIQRI